MTALLLKKSSDPEDSRENFQHDTRESHEKTNDEMPVPDVLQVYRTVRPKDDICVRYQDLPTPKLFWVNPSSKSTTEQTEIVEFQWQAQTFPEVSNPREVGFDVGCEESVLLSCGSEDKTVEAAEVTNQSLIKTTEPLDNVPDSKPSFTDQPEFEKEMIMYQPGLDTKIVPDVITNDKCEETEKTVLVETRNQDLKNREKISDKPQDDTDNHLDDTEKPRDDTEKPWDDTEKPREDTDNRLDNTEKPRDDTKKPRDDTDNHLDDTEKHLNDTDKCLEYTDKSIDDTDKHIDDTDKHIDDTDDCSFGSGEVLQRPVKSESWIEDANENLDGDGDTTRESLLEKVCKEKERTVNSDEEDSNDKPQSDDSVEQKLSKVLEIFKLRSMVEERLLRRTWSYLSVLEIFKLRSMVEERLLRRTWSYLSDLDTTEDEEVGLFSDLDITEDEEERVRSEKLYEIAPLYWDCRCSICADFSVDFISTSFDNDCVDTQVYETDDSSSELLKYFQRNSSFHSYSQDRTGMEYFGKSRLWNFLDPPMIIASLLTENVFLRWHSLEQREEKELLFGNAVRHAVEKRRIREDRWIRFEGEPEIRVEQSLKKRRGVMFGTVSRQGYLGCSDEPDEKLEGGIEQQAWEARKSPWITYLYFLPDKLKENLSSSYKNEQLLEDCICLANKLLTLTYENIDNERQLQQNLTLAEDLYNLNLEKQSNDGKQLTVDENEALVHEFSRIKPFSFPEGEDILNRSDTDQDFEVFEEEESQEKKHDSDSEDSDNIQLQNREFALTDEQVEDCVKKVPRKAQGRESNDGREVQSSSNGCGTDICGAEGVQKEDAFCLFEVAEGDDKKLEVSVEIPLDALGGSIPLDNTYIGTGNRAPKATVQKKSKLKLQVFPNPHQGSRQYSDVDVAVEKKNSKSAFQNLNYKVKVESHSKKKIDSTFTEQDFDKYLEIRGYTWLPLNELPAPKLDPVSVAFLQTFEPVMVIIDQIANGTPPTPHVSMRYELLRFCTLRSYPKENKPHLIRLAMAGFYYASDSDGVVCYCCGVRRYNWVAKDDPMKVHQRINPNCKFLKKNEEVNVPVTYYGPYSEKLTYIMNIPEPVERPQVSEDVNNDWAPERIRSPAPAQQNSQIESGTNALGINTAIPKHPVYATKTTREASYNGWPDSSSHTPQELSDAGFFYAGFGDCVRCFYCGIGLRHWTKDDNPWIEHARWSRNCVYLRQKKGEEFVSLVQLALQYSQDNNSETNEASGNASASQDVEKILLSNAAQSVLEMGYQPKIIKRAIEELLRQNRNAKIVAQTLMEKLLEIEEAEDTVQTAEALAAAEETTPAQHTVKPKSSLSSEATKGTGASNTEGNSKKEGSGSIKAKSQTNDTSENSKVTSNELEKNDSKSLDPKTIKAENELLKEQTLCKVCLDNTVCIVFLPCGHLVTCADCAPAMRKCPICRALVKGTVRTYMS